MAPLRSVGLICAIGASLLFEGVCAGASRRRPSTCERGLLTWTGGTRRVATHALGSALQRGVWHGAALGAALARRERAERLSCFPQASALVQRKAVRVRIGVGGGKVQASTLIGSDLVRAMEASRLRRYPPFPAAIASRLLAEIVALPARNFPCTPWSRPAGESLPLPAADELFGPGRRLRAPRALARLGGRDRDRRHGASLRRPPRREHGEHYPNLLRALL